MYKSSFYCTHGIWPTRATIGGVQHSFEKMSQWWRAVGDTVFDVTRTGIELQTNCTDGDVLTITPIYSTFPLQSYLILASLTYLLIGLAKFSLRGVDFAFFAAPEIGNGYSRFRTNSG